MVSITFRQEFIIKRNYAKKITHLKPAITIIIFSLFLVEYIFYPKIMETDHITQDNVTPNESVTDIDGNVYRMIKIGGPDMDDGESEDHEAKRWTGDPLCD